LNIQTAAACCSASSCDIVILCAIEALMAFPLSMLHELRDIFSPDGINSVPIASPNRQQ
jgi:hypothetical protein